MKLNANVPPSSSSSHSGRRPYSHNPPRRLRPQQAAAQPPNLDLQPHVGAQAVRLGRQRGRAAAEGGDGGARGRIGRGGQLAVLEGWEFVDGAVEEGGGCGLGSGGGGGERGGGWGRRCDDLIDERKR